MKTFGIFYRENIRLGRLNATDSEIEQAAKHANAHNFIMSTTSKYDTQVGERGAQLSGGQKQRIAIARALLRNPKILLLDEATSALDYESERIVQEALEKAKVGRTTIIIAHRLSTIRNADLIVALSAGKLVEMGTHAQLMANQGLYYDLVKLNEASNNNRNVDDDEKQPAQQQRPEESIDDSSDSEDDNDEKQAQAVKRGIEEVVKMNETPIEANKAPEKPNLIKRISQKFKFNPRKIFKYERKLFIQHKREWYWLVIGTISQMLNGIIFPLTVLLFSNIYNIFLLTDKAEQDRQSVMFMGLIWLIDLINTVAIIASSSAFAVASARLTKRLRIAMFSSILRQEMGFHDLSQNKSSILSAKLAASVPLCKGLILDKLSLYSQGFAGVGFAIIYSFSLNAKLAALLCIFIPISFLCSAFVAQFTINTKNSKGNSATEEAGRIAVETIENIKTVVSLGREKYFIDEFHQVFDQKFFREIIKVQLQGLPYSMSNSLLFFVQAAAFGYGYQLMKTDNLAVADLFRIYAALTFTSMTLGRLYAMMPDQTKCKEGARVTFRIIDRKSKIDALNDAGISPAEILGDIRFENIDFSYPNRPSIKILNGFNLSIKNGQTNALVGASGCGKSTTIALLLRFYDPDSGTIYLDGMDIRTLNINWLRSKIGLVSQEPVLFNTSIHDNICNGDIARKNASHRSIKFQKFSYLI